jgi:hypothetical protein
VNDHHVDDDSTFVCKDINGNYVLIKKEELMDKVKELGLTLFGMDIDAIVSLRKGYMQSGGKLPITKESVEELYR